MTSKQPVEILEKGGVRPTANRILVIRALLESDSPLSMSELECRLETMEKSSVFRVLNVLLEHDLVHALEDGRGIVKYEVCHGEGHCSISDMHAHFYCESCHKTFCFENVGVPDVGLPEDFHIRSINFMLKGLCPRCSEKIQ
ncbi:MAG: transcriptional repressor [Muribaculaceae bacterium]|nr:transcriptional repressor [Muribaculaceae bacterium]MDE6330921.1 transcriptional repressor [Muribaculaceae bacterium]